MIRRSYMVIPYTVLVAIGYCIYLVTGKTPAFSYQSMVKLFCLTQGRSNDWLSAWVGSLAKPYPFDRAGVPAVGVVQDEERKSALSALRDTGYYVFRRKIPGDMCDRLLQFALTQPSEVSPMDGQSAADKTNEIYVRGKPRAVRYIFDPVDLLKSTDVQSLIADLSLAAVAQDYLGARPVIDVLTMWWLTDFAGRPDSQAAQFFHFDMDRPKWVKIFIYLTDVQPSTGPHSFVAGSHRTGGIPQHLLDKGYTRLADDEVRSAYPESSIREIVAPRGTILAEDTRGLHKGKHIVKGDRLMLQIQYSNCLFGGDYPKISFQERIVPALRESLGRFPRLYSAYFSKPHRAEPQL
jgi:hypothetical protein